MTGGVKLASKKIVTANYGGDTLSIINNISTGEVNNIDLKELVSKKNKCIKPQMLDKIGPIALTKDRHGNLLVINSWDDSLFRIDIQKMILMESIKVGRYPINIKLFADKIYVLNADSSSLSIIDEKDFILLESINLGGKPTDLQIDEENENIYIANYDNYNLSRISINTGEITNIALPFQPLKIVLEKDFIFILAFLNNGLINYSQLSKLNIHERKIMWSIKIKGIYYDFIKLNKREYFALIDSQSAYLYELDSKGQKINKKIHLGGLPNKIITDNEKLYINDLLNDEIIVLDILDYGIKYRIRVGKEPQGIFLL